MLLEKTPAPARKIMPSGYFKMLARDFFKNKYLYLMIVPLLAYYAIFHYWPMYGASIAFKRYSLGKGIMGSEWIGFKHFIDFFTGPYFFRVTRNTLLINIYLVVFGFPAPIILALMLNELRQEKFKRLVQTISYLPHFVSITVIAGMIIHFAAPNGVFNYILGFFGVKPSVLMAKKEAFRAIYVGSSIWQELGWSSIIYLAALAGIDTEQYQAARVDGAGKWKQLIHITIPGIIPTVIIMFILRMGQMMNIGFEKVILLYSPVIYETADVIQTYVYRKGLNDFSYDYSAAVGLFNSVINFALLMIANFTMKKVSEHSLW